METTLEIPSLSVSGIIKEKIRKNGPISFYDYMKMALYYPEIGYYTSETIKIGPEGDYYTSPFITPIFGELIGKQIEEMWHLLGEKPFTIVEYGAGQGLLCSDVLFYLKNNEDLYKDLSYYIIEKNSFISGNEEVLAFGKVHLIESILNIAPINGCILSNELVDNFPVHKVLMDQELMEVFVDYNQGFIERLLPAPKAIKEYFAELNIVLPKGFCTEVNLEATQWIKEIAHSLQKGYLLTIDYGYSSGELYNMNRSKGTMVCYSKHKINNNPYYAIGKQDITSHVNFSALCHWGLKYGIECCGFTQQAYFLLAMGLEEYIRNKEQSHGSFQFNAQQIDFFINTFMGDMGTKLKVLIQRKGVLPHKLSGLKFSLKSL